MVQVWNWLKRRPCHPGLSDWQHGEPRGRGVCIPRCALYLFHAHPMIVCLHIPRRWLTTRNLCHHCLTKKKGRSPELCPVEPIPCLHVEDRKNSTTSPQPCISTFSL